MTGLLGQRQANCPMHGNEKKSTVPIFKGVFSPQRQLRKPGLSFDIHKKEGFMDNSVRTNTHY